MRRFVQVVEVRGEDVAGREALLAAGLDVLDHRRVQRGLRDEAVRARCRVLPDRCAFVSFERDAQSDERQAARRRRRV